MFDIGDVVKLVGPKPHIRYSLSWLDGMERYRCKDGIIIYADDDAVKIDGFGDYYFCKTWLEPVYAEDNFESEDLQSLFE